MFHLVFALCVYLCSCVSIIHQIWTSNPESGSQRTKCSTFLCLLYLYVCVPILHQKCSNSGQVTHNQAPKCSTFYACISICVILLNQERSNSGPVTQRRIPMNQMFHLCICVVCVFVCRCSFTPTKVYTGSGSQQTKFSTTVCVLCVCVSIIHQKCSNSGQFTQNQAPNEPIVPPLYVCCVLL